MPKIISNKSNVDLDYPVVRPSLDLDFTQEELDPRITFSRGSIGTRVNRNRLIETVAANQPRFDYDPVTGECKGLLIEESRINYAYPSIYPGSGPNFWTSVIQNSNTSPDGTFTAVNYIWRNSANCYGAYPSITNTAGIPYTGSCFIKPNDNTSSSCVQIGRNDSAVIARCVFSHSTKTVSVNSTAGVTNASASITPFPNGWYRISVTATFTSSYSNFALFFVAISNNGNVYTWGFQLEQGAFPTSYIPTSGSTVTRSADLASMTGTNFSSWYNQNEGTIYSNVNFTENLSTSNFSVNNIIYSINNNTLSNRITLFGFNTTKSIIPRYTVSNFTYPNPSVTISSGQNKFIHSFKSTDVSLVSNGRTPSIAQIMAVTYPTVNQFEIGAQIGSLNLNGTISRLTYYPRALKPNQLQYLTQ